MSARVHGLLQGCLAGLQQGPPRACTHPLRAGSRTQWREHPQTDTAWRLFVRSEPRASYHQLYVFTFLLLNISVIFSGIIHS